MAKTIISEGKTTNEAIENGLKELKVSKDKVEIKVLEDENSSQTSQTGFDNGLVKKNKIEEIRNNLMMNISNFYTLKYILTK